jgi:GNAT superfamily N-acetyltransferase
MIKIEAIKKSDLNQLANLYDDLFWEKTNLISMHETFEWIQSNPNYIVLGAKMDDNLVASLTGILCPVMMGQCRPFMFIESVIVSHNYRKLGIGRRLMEEIERIAREKNCYLIQFVSSDHRKEAHQFYEAIGYNVDKVRGFRKILRSKRNTSL